MKEVTTSVQYIEISEEFAEQRIDNFLFTRFKGIPKTKIYSILRKGEIRVNKKRVQPSYRLKKADYLRIPPLRVATQPISPLPSQQLANFLTKRILYEDKSLLIINKPSGLAVHGGSGVKLGLVEALRKIYPKSPHLELAHRLDADTSGCLILAKKRSVLKELHSLMREGKVIKKYIALTKGIWKKEDFSVEAPLKKNILQSGERIVKVHQEGKISHTIFTPIKIFKNASLVEALLHTGRTHQIRVHAQYKGHPLAADPKYGDDSFTKYLKKFGLSRLFLHAKSVQFTLLSSGQNIFVEAPLDDDLVNCLRKLEKEGFN